MSLERAERNGSRRQIRRERRRARDRINMQLSTATLKEWKTGTLVVSYEGLRRSKLMHLPHLSLRLRLEELPEVRAVIQTVSQSISFVPHVRQFCHAIAWSQGTVRLNGGVEGGSFSHSCSFTSLLRVHSVCSLLYIPSDFTQAGSIVATDITYGIQNDKSIITACVKLTHPSHRRILNK